MNYRATLAYDGSDFEGSQRQGKTGARKYAPRTVQGELEKALRKIGWKGPSVILAGRTDTGVHATGQVTAFEIEWTHSDEELLKALNAELPFDIAIRNVSQTTADFHPRFNATSRAYQYRVFFDPVRHPLLEKYAWRVNYPLDLAILKETANLFLGEHDFSSFGSRTSPKGTTIRTVKKTEWKKLPDGQIQFEVWADAFLYRMVRRLVFTQISVARGKCSGVDIQNALDRQAKLPAGLAPSSGLTLIEVTY